ncbi:hypothetical protein FHX53_001431 [Yonghaparkia alkaliphila]|uniref:Uncharacterized protein n=1 Tax=Microcella alkalica TaxID=355930 RepID=A0A839E5A3_9MICO|nr:hypothetical protein [Microcella alkalica]
MTGPELVDRVRAGWRVVREGNARLAENLPAPAQGAR